MRATFANEDDGLIPGDFGRIIIYSNNDFTVPTIPSKAIQENQEGKYVYVLDEKNLPKLIYIKTLGQEGENTLIDSGLKIGDTVITSGLQKVITGMPVKIVEEEVTDKTQKKPNIFVRFFNKVKRIGRK